MNVPAGGWLVTALLFLALFTVDLLVADRRARRPTVPESARWLALFCAAALAFGVVVWVIWGGRYAGQFYVGWLTEYSLSVDNLFVFLVLMARFGVPDALQSRVLTVGILLALVLRAVLIAVGAAAISAFSWVFYLFGAFLVWTAWKLLRSGAQEADDEEGTSVARAVERLLPTTRSWHGTRLVVREAGRRLATPLLLVMIAIGLTDVMFALDSIPAIFGLTREPYLVVAANAFALMGLRQLFFLIGGLLDRLRYLAHGLAVVLGFVGVKLVLEALHVNTLPFVNGGRPVAWAPEIPILVSLLVVAGTLALTTGASLAVARHRSSR
jgi:tellurite resistance protein TerC